jgi:hypothetical protein
MPTTRSLLAGLALSLTAISCSQDQSPTAPPDQPAAPSAPVSQAAKQALIFQAGQQYTSAAGVVYTLQTVQVTQFARNTDPATSAQFPLSVSGEFTFTDAAGGIHKERFANAPADLNSVGAATMPTCRILELDIGAIHLDLLGLVVDLAPVHLDITAQSGPGNLLGNLLCALTHLLDQNALGTALTNLLNTINQLLQQLLG